MQRKNIFTIIAAALLFLALFDGWPYGYFTLLRFAVCAVTAYCAYLAYSTKQEKWAWPFGILAVLFNPIIPIHLDRGIWSFIDFAVTVFLVISVFYFKVDGKGGKDASSKNSEKLDGRTDIDQAGGGKDI